MSDINLIAWSGAAFLAGAVPFSVLVARFGLKADIRNYGDGNPGAANVWRAGGPRWGVLAVLLDYLKGAIPVGLANFLLGYEGVPMAAIALAPILGHSVSPFLGWKGGKALAVTFGVWTGLSLWVIPLALGGLFFLWLYLLSVEGWAVLAGMLGLVPLFLALPANSVWWWVWLGNLVILTWSHRQDLRQTPHRRRSHQK